MSDQVESSGWEWMHIELSSPPPELSSELDPLIWPPQSPLICSPTSPGRFNNYLDCHSQSDVDPCNILFGRTFCQHKITASILYKSLPSLADLMVLDMSICEVCYYYVRFPKADILSKRFKYMFTFSRKDKQKRKTEFPNRSTLKTIEEYLVAIRSDKSIYILRNKQISLQILSIIKHEGVHETKCKEGAVGDSSNESVLKHTCRHHEQIHPSIVEKNNESQLNLDNEDEDGSLNQSSPKSFQSIQTSETRIDIEPKYINENDEDLGMDVSGFDKILEDSVQPHDELTLQSIQTSEIEIDIDLVRPHNDSSLHSTETSESVKEMEVSFSLEKMTTEEAIGIVTSSHSLPATTVADKQCKRKRSQKQYGRPRQLISDVNATIPYSCLNEQLAVDNLLECRIHNKASSSQRRAATTVEDKQCKRKRSPAKGRRSTKSTTDGNVMIPYSSLNEQVAANGFPQCSSHNHASSSQSLGADTMTNKQHMGNGSPKKSGRPTKLITDMNVILPYSNRTMQEAANNLNIGISTLKRSCRKMGINDWSQLKGVNVTAEPVTYTQSSLTNRQPKKDRRQNAELVTVKATYKGDTTKLKLFFPSKKVDLDEQLARKLKLNIGSFKMKYVDEENDDILVSTDSDFEDCITSSRSQSNNTIRLLVEPITI